MASAAQVSERFEIGRAVGYARLGGLVKLGLLEHLRIFHGTPGVYLATRSGLDVVDLDLPAARADIRTYKHDLELSSLVIGLEREYGAERLATEREMRATDTPSGSPPTTHPRFAVPLAGSQGRIPLTPVGYPRLHFPDCAIVGSHQADPIVAVELERTAKGRTRLRGILAAYVACRHIEGVRYYATTPRVSKLLADQISRLRADELIDIRTRFEEDGILDHAA
jgi:hypothetical protein